MTTDQILILIALSAYIMATLALLTYFLSREPFARMVGIPFAFLGCITQFVELLLRWQTTHIWPLTNLYGSLSLFSAMSVAFFIGFALRYDLWFLGGFVTALASPTLGARASSARRAAAPAERSGALAVAAARLGTTPARLEVRNLAAIDLGRGIAVVGTLNLRGRAKPRVDHRLWFIAEQMLGRWTLTLANVQTITVSEPLLEEPSEYLIDALDLGGGSVGVVTRIIGYDAESYAIYTRRGAAWKSVYTGGGGAN